MRMAVEKPDPPVFSYKFQGTFNATVFSELHVAHHTETKMIINFNVLKISDDAFTYYSREWLFCSKNNDRKINELISGNLVGKLPNKSRHNQFLSVFLILESIGCCSATVLM